MNKERGLSPEQYNAGDPARDFKGDLTDDHRTIGAFSVPQFRSGERGMSMEKMEDLGIVTQQAREDMASFRMYERGDYDPQVERLIETFRAAGEKNDEKLEEDARFALQAGRKNYWTNIKAGNAISGQGVLEELEKVKKRIFKYSEILEQESQRGSEDNDAMRNTTEALEIWQRIEDMVENDLPAVRAAIDGH